MQDISLKLIQAGLVLLIAVLLRLVLMLVIRHTKRLLILRAPKAVERIKASPAAVLLGQAELDQRHKQRVKTLAAVLRNATDIVLVTVSLLTILAIFGIPMGPLLASAGVGGVALGFGAQSLVKDYIAGAFMLAEDQFGVGDLISVDDLVGTVEEVTLRVTKVRDSSGTIWYLRNGDIVRLGNRSQANTVTILEVFIAPDEDPVRAGEVVQQALAGMDEEADYAEALEEEPVVLGVGRVDAAKMVLQVKIVTGPNEQWAVLRQARARSQRALREAGIAGAKLGIDQQP